jgi:hypothetical protein
MNATPAWLSLSRKERSDFTDSVLVPIYQRYPKVSARVFDVEAFSADCSDIVMYETESIQEYQFMIDAIRDTEIFTKPYFEIVRILPAIEEGYLEYDSHLSGPNSD